MYGPTGELGDNSAYLTVTYKVENPKMRVVSIFATTPRYQLITMMEGAKIIESALYSRAINTDSTVSCIVNPVITNALVNLYYVISAIENDDCLDKIYIKRYSENYSKIEKWFVDIDTLISGI